jgi:hypothetical protein
MKTDTTAELTRESLLRLRANDSEEMTETTWGDFIDSNGFSTEELADIRTRLIAGRKAVIGGGAAPVLTVFWPTKGVTP